VEAREAVESVVRLARDKGYRKRLGQIQIIMRCYHGFIDEDFPKTFEALEEVLSIAGDEKDAVTLILASMWLGVLRAFDCDFEKARSSLQTAVDFNVAANSLWGIAVMKAQLAYFGNYWAGDMNSLAGLSSEALRIAEESGDPISWGVSHTSYGVNCYVNGHLEDAKHHLLEGGKLLGRIGVYGWETIGYSSLAETYFEMKNCRKSTECYDQGSRILG
jgi:hypothetical protein